MEAAYLADAEVIDLKEANVTCDIVPDMEIDSHFMTANTLDGRVVVCGGSNHFDQCDTFDPVDNLWKSFPTLREDRYQHASVQLSKDSFWILGRDEGFLFIKFYN